ncbi:MAG: hypothetical protein H7840_06450 [Alphaproteobacteria bacterium]
MIGPIQARQARTPETPATRLLTSRSSPSTGAGVPPKTTPSDAVTLSVRAPGDPIVEDIRTHARSLKENERSMRFQMAGSQLKALRLRAIFAAAMHDAKGATSVAREAAQVARDLKKIRTGAGDGMMADSPAAASAPPPPPSSPAPSAPPAPPTAAQGSEASRVEPPRYYGLGIETGKLEVTRGEPGKPETSRVETIRLEAVRVEAGKVETVTLKAVTFKEDKVTAVTLEKTGDDANANTETEAEADAEAEAEAEAEADKDFDKSVDSMIQLARKVIAIARRATQIGTEEDRVMARLQNQTGVADLQADMVTDADMVPGDMAAGGVNVSA